MPVTIFQVDAFTDTPFRGNPAGVCLLPAPRPEAWMQQVAAEMNVAETAFLVPEGAGYRLRWFTPTVEVDLCGHATLASAHTLWEQHLVPPGEAIAFETLSGTLTCRRVQNGQIEMDFPAEPPKRAQTPKGLVRALGLTPRYVGRNRMDLLVLLRDADLVRTLAPDLTRLAAVEARGVIVTAPADEGDDVDFVSRFFAPRAGVPEDPVTGSAHCALAPFWKKRLRKKVLRGRQESARGGIVEVEPRKDRVLLRGQAVTVLRCALLGEGQE